MAQTRACLRRCGDCLETLTSNNRCQRRGEPGAVLFYLVGAGAFVVLERGQRWPSSEVRVAATGSGRVSCFLHPHAREPPPPIPHRRSRFCFFARAADEPSRPGRQSTVLCDHYRRRSRTGVTYRGRVETQDNLAPSCQAATGMLRA